VSGPVCYLERDEGGDAIVRARLFAPGGETSWTPPARPDRDNDESIDIDPLEVPAALAEWLSNKVGPGGALGAIVLDPTGSLCAWTDSVNAGARLLPAAVSGLGADDDHAGPGTLSALLGPDHESPGAASLAALEPEAAERGEGRTAVVSVEDAAVRVLIDELDRLGVTVAATYTLWEALARVWGPGSPGAGGAEGGLIVADSAVPAAVVMHAGSGLLAWCWTLRGRVRCGGAMRTPVIEDEVGESAAAFGAEDAGRLASDWLGWAAQLGAGPERVVWIGPRAPVGSALGRLWPGATTDAATFDDPIAETIGRLEPGDRQATGQRTLDSLANRPGRAHRSASRWVTIAMLIVAALAGVWGLRAGGAAGAAGDRAAEIRAAWKDRAREIDPNADAPGQTILTLQAIRDSLSAARAAPEEMVEPLDVMYEVENISLVLGGAPEAELVTMRVDQIRAQLVVLVPSLAEYEAIEEGLASIGGSISWQGRAQEEGGKLRGTFTGTWITETPGGGA